MTAPKNASRYLEHSLRELCPSRPQVPKLDRQPREGLTPLGLEYQESFPMGDPVGLSFQVADRRLPAGLRNDFLGAAGAIARLGRKRQVVREFLAGASVPGGNSGHLADGVSMVSAPGFGELSLPTQLCMIDAWRRLTAGPGLRRALVQLADARILAQMTPASAHELVRYIGGPKAGLYSEPAHAEILKDRWSSRATDTCALVERLREGLGRSVSAEARLAEFFHEAVRHIHVLRKRTLTIVVLGDPKDPGSLSYSHTLFYPRGGVVEAWIQCPDQRVGAGWRTQAPHCESVFSCQSGILSRLEECTLLRWIEYNHVISERGGYWPKQLPSPVLNNCLRLERIIESVANRISSVRGGAGFRPSLRLKGEIHVRTRNRPSRVSRPGRRTGVSVMRVKT